MDSKPYVIKNWVIFLLGLSFSRSLAGLMDCLIHLLQDSLLQDILVIHSHAKTLKFLRTRAGRCRLDTLSVDLQHGSALLTACASWKKKKSVRAQDCKTWFVSRFLDSTSLFFVVAFIQSSPLVPSSGPALAGQTGVASELCLSLEKALFADPPVAPSSSNPPGVRAALAGLKREEGPWSSGLSTGIVMRLENQRKGIVFKTYKQNILMCK